MNRKELIEALTAKTGSSKADADRNIGALTEIITGTLKKGDNVALVGFGTFEVRERAARPGRNPATGEAMKIKASRAPAFKAGSTLKTAVNGARSMLNSQELASHARRLSVRHWDGAAS